MRVVDMGREAELPILSVAHPTAMFIRYVTGDDRPYWYKFYRVTNKIIIGHPFTNVLLLDGKDCQEIDLIRWAMNTITGMRVVDMGREAELPILSVAHPTAIFGRVVAMALRAQE
jgi:hypothetical protein